MFTYGYILTELWLTRILKGVEGFTEEVGGTQDLIKPSAVLELNKGQDGHTFFF